MVLNRKHNYLKIPNQTLIENFLCKALWKVTFYSALLIMYLHTSKNAQKHLFVNRWMIWKFFCDTCPPNQSTVHHIQKGMTYFRCTELGQKTQVSWFCIKEVTKMDYPNRKQKASKMSLSEPSEKVLVLAMSCCK